MTSRFNCHNFIKSGVIPGHTCKSLRRGTHGLFEYTVTVLIWIIITAHGLNMAAQALYCYYTYYGLVAVMNTNGRWQLHIVLEGIKLDYRVLYLG
jgi:hypothetical protein